MDVVCQSCNKKVSIPDSKVPKKGQFSFNCPSCKSKVTVGTAVANGKAPASTANKKEAADMSTGEAFDADSQKSGAMVCHTQPEKLKALLEGMGYQVHTPSYHIEAINNIRFNQYKVIIITAEYQEQPHEMESVLEILQNMMMDKRRNIFVLYVVPGIKSFDELEAFAASVNALATPEDMEKTSIATTLEKLIKENAKFFKIYNEIGAELGKV